MGPRWQTSQLGLDLDPLSVYIHCKINKLNDTPRGTTTVSRANEKVDSGPISENLHPFPKIAGIILLLNSL